MVSTWMVYTRLWLAFNGSRAMVSTPRVLCNACNVWCNVGLHLNGFLPYTGILTGTSKQATKHTSKKTDFTVDPIWWGSLRLAPITKMGRSEFFELDPATQMTQRKSDSLDPDMWIDLIQFQPWVTTIQYSHTQSKWVWSLDFGLFLWPIRCRSTSVWMVPLVTLDIARWLPGGNSKWLDYICSTRRLHPRIQKLQACDNHVRNL